MPDGPDDREWHRKFVCDLWGPEVTNSFTTSQLPLLRFYDRVRHGDTLRGDGLRSDRVGVWHVIYNRYNEDKIRAPNPIRDATVYVSGRHSCVVVFPDLVGSTLTVSDVGCQVYALGRVNNSTIKAPGTDSQIHLLGPVSGTSEIEADLYTTLHDEEPGVIFRGERAPTPGHLRELVLPPLRPLSSDDPPPERPRSPLLFAVRRALSGGNPNPRRKRR